MITMIKFQKVIFKTDMHPDLEHQKNHDMHKHGLKMACLLQNGIKTALDDDRCINWFQNVLNRCQNGLKMSPNHFANHFANGFSTARYL